MTVQHATRVRASILSHLELRGSGGGGFVFAAFRWFSGKTDPPWLATCCRERLLRYYNSLPLLCRVVVIMAFCLYLFLLPTVVFVC